MSAPRSKPYAESCDYNKYPIADVLRDVFEHRRSKRSGQALSVLEVGSGTGQHAVYFAQLFREEISRWQTSDLAEELPGISLWINEARDVERLPPPLSLSFTDPAERWAEVLQQAGMAAGADVIFTANTFHIAPWESCVAALPKIARSLSGGGYFVVYGPFNYNGEYTSESNARFDEWLRKNKSPQSGIRHMEDVRDSFIALKQAASG